MSAPHHLTSWEGDLRARRVARQLIYTLDEFNAQHPDPDSDTVADEFDYLTHDYIVRMCASILAESYVMVPSEAQLGEIEGSEVDLVRSAESHNDENEVERS
jgi:hypothetical protein